MRLYKPTIDDMLNSREFYSFIGDRLGNDLFISDPDRADRLAEYAEDGCDGSTHDEVIEDWRAFLDDACTLPERCKDHLRKQIDDVEEWHNKNGSLFEVIG